MLRVAFARGLFARARALGRGGVKLLTIEKIVRITTIVFVVDSSSARFQPAVFSSMLVLLLFLFVMRPVFVNSIPAALRGPGTGTRAIPRETAVAGPVVRGRETVISAPLPTTVTPRTQAGAGGAATSLPR